jgi:hypothetical protein
LGGCRSLKTFAIVVAAPPARVSWVAAVPSNKKDFEDLLAPL